MEYAEGLKRRFITGMAGLAGSAAVFGFNAAPAAAKSERQQVRQAIHELNLDLSQTHPNPVNEEVKHDIWAIYPHAAYRYEGAIKRRVAGHERYFRVLVKKSENGRHFLRAGILPKDSELLPPSAGVLSAPTFAWDRGTPEGKTKVTSGRGKVILNTADNIANLIVNKGQTYQKLPVSRVVAAVK